jgi:hypothetical protein
LRTEDADDFVVFRNSKRASDASGLIFPFNLLEISHDRKFKTTIWALNIVEKSVKVWLKHFGLVTRADYLVG